jgi:hypothetical protein
VGRLRAQAHEVGDAIRKTGQIPSLHPNAGCRVGTAPEVEHLSSEDMNILLGGRGVKDVAKRHHPQSTSITPAPQLGADVSNPQPSGQTQSDVGSAGSASSPGNILDKLHPDLMEDLRYTNQLNQAHFAEMDWTISNLASWQDAQATASTADVPYVPNVAVPAFNNGFEGNSFPAATVAGPDSAFGFDPSSFISGETVGDDLGLVTGGMAWDPSWQSLMDRLGVAEMHST